MEPRHVEHGTDDRTSHRNIPVLPHPRFRQYFSVHRFVCSDHDDGDCRRESRGVRLMPDIRFLTHVAVAGRDLWIGLFGMARSGDTHGAVLHGPGG